MLALLLLLALSATALARPQNEEPIAGSDTVSSDLCPPDLWHFLLPHEYDCTKFYYCEYGEKWVTPRDCALGTHFSFELQVCVHPVQAGCTLPGVPTEAPETEATTSAPSSTEAATISTTEATTSAPSTTEAASISTTEATTSAPSSTEAASISTTEATTLAPSSTEAASISTTEATTSAPSSTEAASISTTEATTSAPSSTEAASISTTAAPSTTEAIITDAPSTAAPEESEWLDNGCPASWDLHWLLPHKECNKFYYCNFGEKLERICPANTYFNPALQVCDHPWNVECASGSEDKDSKEDTEGQWLDNGCPADWNVHWLLPHESDCGKFYYCVRGETVKRECPAQLHFNPKLQVCDWAENVGCTYSGNNGEDENISEEDNNTGDSEWLDNGCPADWNVHWLLPHESDCGKFYYCVHGQTVERECSVPLHFNPALQVCDWAENAGCSLDDNNGEDDNNNGEEEDTVTDSSESEWLDNGCPADWHIHWLLPHESDCGKFYYCVRGETVERECPESLHFNPTLKVCDWAENAGCALDNGGESSGEGGDNNGEDGEDGIGEWLDNGCPADWNVHWLLPHESDCGKFYYCVHGEKVKRECSEPLHFNPTLQVCDWAENAGCQNSENGNSVEDIDNGSGGGEDDNTGIDGDSAEDNAWLDNGCPADWNTHWLLPHETDCGKFYYCAHGQTVESECPEPLHFNPIIQVCDWAENAGCASDGSNGGNGEDGSNGGNGEDGSNGGNGEDGSNGGNGEDGSNGGNGEDGSNGGNGEDGSNGGNGEDGSNGGNGEDGSNGGNGEDGGTVIEPEAKPDNSKCASNCNILPWAHETACDKYWRCEGEEAVLVICSEGLHFNAKTGSCDFICNANCVRESIQTTSDQQGLKIFVPWHKVKKGMRFY